VIKLQRIILLISGLLLTGLFLVSSVEAHAGGKMQLASVEAGPYMLTVWTSPEPVQVGEVHVAAAIVSAYDALPILDAQVDVRLWLQNGENVVLNGRATREDSTNKFLYESVFEVPVEGSYQTTIQVTGADGQQGDVAFDMEVVPRPPLVLGVIALIILAVVTGGAVWFYLRSSQPELIVENTDESDTLSA
jgi:hypothetical protein